MPLAAFMYMRSTSSSMLSLMKPHCSDSYLFLKCCGVHITTSGVRCRLVIYVRLFRFVPILCIGVIKLTSYAIVYMFYLYGNRLQMI